MFNEQFTYLEKIDFGDPTLNSCFKFLKRFEFFYFCKNKDQSLSTSLCDKLKEVSLSEGPGLIRLRSLFLIYFSGQQVTLNLNSFDFLKNVTFHDKSYLCP